MSYKVFKNHNAEEYSKKYSKNTNLVKLTKKEVEQFGKNNALLEKKSWWLIGDTYYEIPSNGFIGWWNGLKPAVKGVSIGGLVAVVAAAITVPLVLINKNPGTKPEDDGDVTQNEWNAALGTNIQIGENANVKVTIEKTDKNESYIYNILGNKAVCLEREYDEDVVYYDLKDDYGYWKCHKNEYYTSGWEFSKNKDDAYSIKGLRLLPIYNALPHYKTKYKYNSNTKSWNYDDTVGSGSGDAVLGSLKFNDKKQLESAVTYNKKTTYKFEYGIATIEDTFPKITDKYKDLTFDESGKKATHDTLDIYYGIHFRFDLPKFTNFDPSTLQIKLTGEDIQDDLCGHEIRIDGVELDPETITFDTTTGIIDFDKTSLKADSKILLRIEGNGHEVDPEQGIWEQNVALEVTVQ